MSKSLIIIGLVAQAGALVGCAKTVTTPGGIPDVVAVDIPGLAGVWEPDPQHPSYGTRDLPMTIRRTGRGRYEVSMTFDEAVKTSSAVAFDWSDKTYIEFDFPAQDDETPYRSLAYGTAVVTNDRLRLNFVSMYFSPSWQLYYFAEHFGFDPEQPVPPQRRAEVVAAFVDDAIENGGDDDIYLVRVK